MRTSCYYSYNTMGQNHDKLEGFKMINVYEIISNTMLQHDNRQANYNCEFDLV